ncbi:MAG TPA: tripartite tricarboxylate transporter substrate binding protein, partial [Burkholderiales bacterium]|nr:tripartite tricarboxylate transporter substrate binding protein [Burkholderiales bacterium]
YPSKPIRLIAPYPPGGGVDATARIVATALSEALAQQVVVDNRGGASGQIGTEIAAQTAPDGYTLLLGSVAPNAIIPAAYPKLPYDAVKDFAPVSLVAESDYILAVHPSLPVKTVPQLIALAKARPGQIVYASTGNLGGPHLAGELFKQLAKVDMIHVAYKGGGPATTSILSGETSLIFGSGPTVVPHAKVGRLRLIATTGTSRSKVLPELPTVDATLPGHEVTQWYGILVPAKTPAAIISRLNAELVKALATSKVMQQLERVGATGRTTTPGEFGAHIKPN